MGRTGVIGDRRFASFSTRLWPDLRPHGSPLQAMSSVVAWLAASCSTSGVPPAQYQRLRRENWLYCLRAEAKALSELSQLLLIRSSLDLFDE
jgi:hypothetical protein